MNASKSATFLQVRRLVHAMQRRHVVLPTRCAATVSLASEHELLDQAMRDVALGGDDRFDLAVLGRG